MTQRIPTPYDDIINSRDVIEAIQYLTETGEDPEGLLALTKFANEAKDYAEDWEYGEALIRDSYFVEYAQGLAEDCGYLKPSSVSGQMAWPYTFIDWQRAAAELQMDYAGVDFAGVTYWVR
jgi:hypothetical protein